MNEEALGKILCDFTSLGAKVEVVRDSNGMPSYINITPKEPFTKEQWKFIEEMSKK